MTFSVGSSLTRPVAFPHWKKRLSAANRRFTVAGCRFSTVIKVSPILADIGRGDRLRTEGFPHRLGEPTGKVEQVQTVGIPRPRRGLLALQVLEEAPDQLVDVRARAY